MIHIIHTPASVLARQRIRRAWQSLWLTAPVLAGMVAGARQAYELRVSDANCDFTGVLFVQETMDSPPTRTKPARKVMVKTSPGVALLPLPELISDIEFPTCEWPDLPTDEPVDVFETELTLEEPVQTEQKQAPLAQRTETSQSEYIPPVYHICPHPHYPPKLRQRRVEGCVEICIMVQADGTPAEVQITTGSGNHLLDSHVRNWVLQHWHFHPAFQNGIAVTAMVKTSIRFELNN